MRNPTKVFNMKSLRRYNLTGKKYFITAVTLKRAPILLENLSLFWSCWVDIKPEAWVILSNHFHIIIDVAGGNILRLMHNFKLRYSIHYRKSKGTGKVWQNRFWDHIIRDNKDLNRHLDYIHYNPVKHGFVNNPFDYRDSSL
ncbi:MAG: hypothetical protein NTV06_08035 [candidate division Zixibacteria bacterium]|nr:hypothetical protein [candidate division Zixibacteria bacterium]